MTVTAEHDVVIVGAGPAGMATAISLARSGRRVLLVERRNNRRSNSGETIAPAAKITVKRLLGPVLDGPLPDWAAENRGNISVWGSEEPASQDYAFNPYGSGLCIDRAGFDHAMLTVVRGLGVDVIMGATITDAEYSDGRWSFSLRTRQGPKRRQSAYLVDGTGRTAALSRGLGIDGAAHDPLFAYAARFFVPGDRARADNSVANSDRDGTTRIEACAYGWWYSNRLPKAAGAPAERLLVLHTDRDSDAGRMARSMDGFLALLSETVMMRRMLDTHGYVPGGRLTGSPAGQRALPVIAAPGFLAVGDAAQTHDPLSSQGIERALQSGTHAGHALQYALSNASEPEAFLGRYQQQMSAHWQRYLQQHAQYYGMEPRWSGQRFWARRRALRTTRNEFARDAL